MTERSDEDTFLDPTAGPARGPGGLRAVDEDCRADRGRGGRPRPGRAGPLPVLAVVGRPNVGKSTLVNRILGRREAVVAGRAGRDPRPRRVPRRVGRPRLHGRRHRRLGGRRPRPRRRASRSRPRSPSTSPTPWCFVVDATVGATATDERVVTMLRRSGKPVVLAANKVDDQKGEADAAALWSLGLGEPFPVSAVHGRGSGDLLDAVGGGAARHLAGRRAPTPRAGRAGSR